jgi:hypothetical protein
VFRLDGHPQLGCTCWQGLALAAADQKDDIAKDIGAANTMVWRSQGGYKALNTDWVGVKVAIEKSLGSGDGRLAAHSARLVLALDVMYLQRCCPSWPDCPSRVLLPCMVGCCIPVYGPALTSLCREAPVACQQEGAGGGHWRGWPSCRLLCSPGWRPGKMLHSAAHGYPLLLSVISGCHVDVRPLNRHCCSCIAGDGCRCADRKGAAAGRQPW